MLLESREIVGLGQRLGLVAALNKHRPNGLAISGQVLIKTMTSLPDIYRWVIKSLDMGGNMRCNPVQR